MTAKEQHKKEMWEAWNMGIGLTHKSKHFEEWYEKNFFDPESLKIAHEEGMKEGSEFEHKIAMEEIRKYQDGIK